MSTIVATVTLPTWVAVSQWVLVFGLGFFVLLAYRQLGFMLGLKDIGTDRDGLPVGEKAPAFEYLPVDSSTAAAGRFDPLGTWSVLLFADPGCVSCQTAVAGLERLAPTLRETQVLVVTSAEPAVISAVEEFREASVPISRVPPEVAIKLYRTLSTPYAYVIDPQGVIKAKGVAADETALRKLTQKADRQPIVPVAHAPPDRVSQP
jgi:hypothetical protein